MEKNEQSISCDRHGTMNQGFLCRHLVEGESLGFNLGTDDNNQDELWPDAWCDACEDIFQEEGGWNEKSMPFADIQLICSGCYEEIRERNWRQDEKLLDKFITDSCSYLVEKQSSFLETYKINDHERWDWDAKTGELVFSDQGKPLVRAEIHFAGTYSTTTETWMWAWANESMEEKAKELSRSVRKLGEEKGFLPFCAGHWHGSETDAWDMTAVLAKNIGAIGSYRTPSENGFTFMVVSKAEWLV